MKQRITSEQLEELTDEQKEKLRTWWDPQPLDVYAYQKSYRNVVAATYEDIGKGKLGTVIAYMTHGRDLYNEPWRNIHYKIQCLPILSIGQMIEILSDKDKLDIVQLSDIWRVDVGYSGSDSVELCDALWESIKQILQTKSS